MAGLEAGVVIRYTLKENYIAEVGSNTKIIGKKIRCLTPKFFCRTNGYAHERLAGIRSLNLIGRVELRLAFTMVCIVTIMAETYSFLHEFVALTKGSLKMKY